MCEGHSESGRGEGPGLINAEQEIQVLVMCLVSRVSDVKYSTFCSNLSRQLDALASLSPHSPSFVSL